MPIVKFKDLPKPTKEQKRSARLERRFSKRFGFSRPGSLCRSMSKEEIDRLTEKALREGEPPKGWRELTEMEMGGELDL